MPKRVTASLIRSLTDRTWGDPDFIEAAKKRDPAWAASVAKIAADSRPIVDELRMVGYDIDSLDELRRSGKKYATAIPIMLRWLETVENDNVRETLVRGLSVPWARGAADSTLLDFYKRLDNERQPLKWATGNAISIVAGIDHLNEILDLVSDKTNGTSRQMMVHGLSRFRGDRTIEVLMTLLNDDDVNGQAIVALGKLRARNAAVKIEPFLKHPKAWIRTAARKALSRIEAV